MQKGLAPLLIIVIIFAILLAGGAGWYFLAGPGRSSTASSTTPSETSMTTDAEPTGEVTETMSSLIGRGQNLECDWRMPTSAGETPFGGAGKLYTSGNKGRSHFSGNVSGMQMEANAIFRDESIYTWMMVGGQKMGFKMDPSELASANNSMTPQQRQQAEQIRGEMIFNCHSWIPDEAQFTVPSDVTFR